MTMNKVFNPNPADIGSVCISVTDDEIKILREENPDKDYTILDYANELWVFEEDRNFFVDLLS